MTSKYDPYVEIVDWMFRNGDSSIHIAEFLTRRFGVAFDPVGLRRWWKWRHSEAPLQPKPSSRSATKENAKLAAETRVVGGLLGLAEAALASFIGVAESEVACMHREPA